MENALQFGIWIAAGAVLLIFLKRRRTRRSQS